MTTPAEQHRHEPQVGVPVVDAALVSHIARLARLEVSADELPGLVQHFSRMLEWMRVLDEIDAQGDSDAADAIDAESLPVAVPSSVGEPNSQPYTREDLLTRAPAREGSFFVVPKVMG